MLPLLQPYTGLAVALGIGLLVGLERERRKGEGPQRRAAGIRTFTITALLGAVALLVGGMPVLGVAAAGVLALSALAYLRRRIEDPGLTTEVALVMTLLLGGYALQEPVQAAGLGAILAGLLAARAPLHRFVREVLTEAELKSALLFAAATLVVWPLLPDTYIGPYHALNPRGIWTVVILIMAVGAAGHVARRALGARYGLPLAGLASGFVSSSATIAAMGARARADAALCGPASAGAVLSSIATVVQIAILLAATSGETLSAMAVPLVCAGIVAALYAVPFALRLTADPAADTGQPGAAFSFREALLLALMLAVVLLAAAALGDWLGSRGLVVAAAVAGFADAHAIVVSVAGQVASGRLAAADACVPVMVAFSTNSITKIVLAISSGGRGFALRVVPGLLLVLLALWAGLLVQRPALFGLG